MNGRRRPAGLFDRRVGTPEQRDRKRNFERRQADCVRAASGHAAALPSPVMNSRRRIRHASEPL